jgi:hypothetical protein
LMDWRVYSCRTVWRRLARRLRNAYSVCKLRLRRWAPRNTTPRQTKSPLSFTAFCYTQVQVCIALSRRNGITSSAISTPHDHSLLFFYTATLRFNDGQPTTDSLSRPRSSKMSHLMDCTSWRSFQPFGAVVAVPFLCSFIRYP